jgi:cytochrome c oxidase cbb3-type subunit 3
MKSCRLWLLAALAIYLPGCGDRPEQYVVPDQVTAFTALYETNCAGCHGRDGRLGAARPLNDPAFLAVISKQTLRNVITNGVPQTAMPAFAQNAGGTLTEEQITILVDQIQARWSRPGLFAEVIPPSYSADSGDAKRGEAIFQKDCAGCHREKGMGGSLVDPAFLALVSDQSLRTTVIAGRSDRGMPDWRNHSHVMTSEDISDVVAWMSSHRALPFNLTKGGTNLP